MRFSKPGHCFVRFIALFIFLLLVISSAAAQYPYGSLVGTVRDSSEALVSGAAVSVTSAALGISRSTAGNSVGGFRLEALFPGDFQLEVKPGWLAVPLSLSKFQAATASTCPSPLNPTQ